MSLASADLPSDPDALRAFALACQSELAAATAELQAAKLAVQLRTLEIEKLKFQIAKLRRMQFGRSSERHRPGRSSNSNCGSRSWKPAKPKRSARLPPKTGRCRSAKGTGQSASHCRIICRVRRSCTNRRTMVPAPALTCGGGMARLGEDVTEILDYIPGRFQVIRHVRPKYACRRCDAITQAPAPAIADTARPRRPRHAGASAGLEILRSSAACIGRARSTRATGSTSTARP